MLFVRHSQPAIVAGMDRGAWALSLTGRSRAADLGVRLVEHVGSQPARTVLASTEAKAIETGELLALGAVVTDVRLREVSKPWYYEADDHQAAACTYLAGVDLPGWELRAEALGRFDAALAAIEGSQLVVVTHGTILSLWLGTQIEGFDPVPFWLDLEMPDAWNVNPSTNTVERIM